MPTVKIDAAKGEMTIKLPYVEPSKAPLSSSGKTRLVSKLTFRDEIHVTGGPAGLIVSVNACVK